MLIRRPQRSVQSKDLGNELDQVNALGDVGISVTAGLACAFGIFSITIAVGDRLISHLKTHTTHTTRLQIKLHDAQIFRFDSNFNTTESNNKSKSFLFRFGKIIYIGWSNFFLLFYNVSYLCTLLLFMRHQFQVFFVDAVYGWTRPSVGVPAMSI